MQIPVTITTHYTPVVKNATTLIFTATFEDGSQKELHHLVRGKFRLSVIRATEIGKENAFVMSKDDGVLYRCDWTSVPAVGVFEKHYPPKVENYVIV
jgi:hypothetical protein